MEKVWKKDLNLENLCLKYYYESKAIRRLILNDSGIKNILKGSGLTVFFNQEMLYLKINEQITLN